MHLAQVLRYSIMYVRYESTPSCFLKTCEGTLVAARHLLRYLDGTTDFTIVYKKGDFKVIAFSDQLGQQPRQRQVAIVSLS